MIADDLKQLLKAAEPDLATIETFWKNSHFDAEFDRLTAESTDIDFWKRPDQVEILKRLQALRELREEYSALKSQAADLTELIALFESDEAELAKLEPDVAKLVRLAARFKLILLLRDDQDRSNCFLTINAGAGGTESQDWSEMLLRMFVRFCEREKLTATILDMQTGEGAGIKSATLFIKGRNAYGLLKSEHGIHRLVRISPFDANKRRHTSFSGVFVTPEVPEVAITIEPKDLRIDTFRAGGAGGQHVNKTESAIRITHIPSGIVVQCQNERSQTQNKETAMKMLVAKLAQKQRDEQEAVKSSIEKKAIEWGSQIRSYVLHPYKMAKDHRTDHESPQPDLVLDGELMPFIESYLVWNAGQS